MSRVVLPGRRRAAVRRLEALWMMTSLFRRGSAGRGGHHGDMDHGGGEGGDQGGASPGELNSGRPGPRVRRLEFTQAMEDFHSMFPSMEPEVIECVLRANHGAVDATIDQLLQMSLDGHDSDDSIQSDDSIPPEVLERTLEPDSSDEEPPPVYSPPSYDMHIYDRKYPDHFLPAPPLRFDAPPPPSQRPVGNYRNWNPPLLGNLPDDFLRILPQQQDSLPCSQSSLTQPSSSSSLSSLSSVTQAAEPGVSMETEQERKLRWYLEDERVALFLQNHEFMRELQLNRDFLIALERGDDRVCGEACTRVSDEALFSEKLKNMGKSTRRKLLELVRAFSEKTRRRKTKRRDLTTQRPRGSTTSTANLLAEERHLKGDDSKIRRPATQEEEVPQQEVLSW